MTYEPIQVGNQKCPSSQLKEMCLDKMSSSKKTSCILGEKDLLVDCVVCKTKIYSVSQLLDHLKSPCLAKFKTKGLNNETLLTHGGSITNDIAEEVLRTSANDQSSIGLSTSSIKRKRGRPPKRTTKKSHIIQLQGSPEGNSKLINLTGVDKDDEALESEQKNQQRHNLNNLGEGDDLESFSTEVVVLKQESDSNDEVSFFYFKQL